MTFTFISNIAAETIKIRRANALWLTLAGSAFIPLVNFIKIVGRPDVFVSRMKADPWAYFINDNWIPAASFLLPLYLILVASLMAQIEYGNNTWKQVYSTPRSYADIFFSKFLVLNALIITCFVGFTLLIVISAYSAWLINHEYTFWPSPTPWMHLITLSGKMYVSVLGIVAIQFGLSLLMKNFVMPMGIGMALLIAGFMVRQWEYIAYYPYMHPVLVYFDNPGVDQSDGQAMINSVITCGVALTAAYYILCARKEKA